MATYVGTTGIDLRNGGGGEDYLYGDAGDDTLQGNRGNDILRGSYDNDLLYGNGGSDLLDGDDGNDRLYGGNDFDILLGDAGNDTLDGGTGNDVLDGGSGADLLTGGLGADQFAYSKVADSTGAAFDTILDFSTSAGDVLDFSSIDAKARTAGGQDFTFIGQAAFTGEGQIRFYHADGATFVEANTRGSGGAEMVVKLVGTVDLTADSFVLTGGVTSDYASDGFFHGTTSNDSHSGNGGNDYIYGDAGDDRLYGGGDRDIVRGGFGADLLDGGAGSDVLDGSPDHDRDTFRFTGRFGNDLVKDFHPGEDVLAFDVDGVTSRFDLTFSGNMIQVGGYGSVTLASGFTAALLGDGDIVFI